MKKILICFILLLLVGCSPVSTLPAKTPVPGGEKKVQKVPAESEKKDSPDPKDFSDVKLIEEKSGSYKAEEYSVRLYGYDFSSESSRHLSYISVENGDFSLEKIISPDDGSLGDKLLISDITGDGNDEIVVSQVVGMGGGAGSATATVYRIANGGLQEIFGKEECEKFAENGISIRTDGSKTVFENSETGLSAAVGFRLPEDAYVGSFYGFDIDGQGSLTGKQAIISAEDTGYIFSVWKYDKDSLRLSSIYYSEND